MKVLNLQCALGHGFEGWFESIEDYTRQCESGLLTCPLCGNQHVSRIPSAPRFNLGAKADDGVQIQQEDSATIIPITEAQQTVQDLWQRAVDYVLAHTEDVGPRFAEEARRIHYGEVEPKGIRGQLTPDEVSALREEDIEVFSLPVPPLKGTLQ